MGYLLNGQWTEGNPPAEIAKAGTFERIDSVFRDRITADGSSGLQGRGRTLPSLCRAQLPVGAPHHDLSRAQEARRRDQRSRTPFPACASRAGPTRPTRSFPIACPTPSTAFAICTKPIRRVEPDLHRQGHGADAVGQEDPARSSTTIRPKSSACSTASSAGIAGDDTDYYPPRAARPRSIASTRSSTPTSTTASIAAALPSRRRPTTRPSTSCSRALDELEARLARQPHAGRRSHHRSRLAAVADLAALRRRLFLAVQVQPEAHRRLSQSQLATCTCCCAVPGVAGTVNARYYVLGYYSNTSVNPTGIIPRGTPVDFAAVPQRTAA